MSAVDTTYPNGELKQAGRTICRSNLHHWCVQSRDHNVRQPGAVRSHDHRGRGEALQLSHCCARSEKLDYVIVRKVSLEPLSYLVREEA